MHISMTDEYYLYFKKKFYLKKKEEDENDVQIMNAERNIIFYSLFFFWGGEVMRFTPQCYKSKINYYQNSVVVPTVIWGSMAGNREIKMFAPNSDDPNDLCACTIQPRPRPISLRQIPAM